MRILKLSEGNRKLIWVAFMNADKKNANLDTLTKDLRVGTTLALSMDLIENPKEPGPVSEYKLEDADYDHLKQVFESSTGWMRVPESAARVLATRDAIKAAELVKEAAKVTRD